MSVEEFMPLVSLREALVQYFGEFFSNLSLHSKVKRWVEPEHVWVSWSSTMLGSNRFCIVRQFCVETTFL